MELLDAIPPAALVALQIVGSFGLSLAVLVAVRYFVLERLRRWASTTDSNLDDLILAAVSAPSLAWCGALALEIALRTSPMNAEMSALASRAISVLLLLSLTVVGGHVAGGAAMIMLTRKAPDGQVPGLGRVVVRSVVFAIGGLLVLNTLGVEVAPLLTALGVGGLAVALALQDTLSNFFAGIHILLEQPYNIGQFIKLDDGQEGIVLDIGWRTTRIRTILDDVIVVPNNKMAGSTILNYHMPIMRSRVVMKLGVDYASDPEHVRAVVIDEAIRAQADLDYLLADPAPVVLMTGFGDFSLDFDLRFHVTDVLQQPAALDELHRRLFRRFKEEGIGIPFPVRTLHLHKMD